jgi:ribosomal protein L2
MTDALEQILLLEPLEEQRDEEITDSITHRMHAELLRAMARVERNRRDVATRVRFITYDPADEAMLLLAAFGSGPLEGVELWCKGS